MYFYAGFYFKVTSSFIHDALILHKIMTKYLAKIGHGKATDNSWVLLLQSKQSTNTCQYYCCTEITDVLTIGHF